ncbi:hypothetical protein, conserved [Plasmodium vivax]|uniref:Sporozoite invasion-associated protein 2 n=1 Tax=Plasmodium vivax (strain Salvador I) TaxID=126793 RepID=A5K5F3_PLAVS|nr:hypothetical protein, conserved [Plasmodium vivax]EDL45138.1 hypothetical protein, conserved [Plasmodium vivax]|eukprot:XP_001614865.1 hypothetical protein [Plasmodium vivax Sal-1]
MEARRKYYYCHSLLSIGTLLFFISTFQLCSSSQLELEPAPDYESTSPTVPVRLLLHDDYAPNAEDMFGPEASQVMTNLYETIDEDGTTTDGYQNGSDDDQSNQSDSNDDAVMLNYLSNETDSFDELIDEIDNHKKKKKIYSPLRKPVLKRSDSSDSLSDYELDEVLRQTENEPEEDEDLDLSLEDSFEVINYPWKDILESSPYSTDHTNEEDFSSLEELELEDPVQEMNFGKLKFFEIGDPDLLIRKTPITPNTKTKSGLEKNGNNTEASNINQHEKEKMDKRKRRTHKQFKNPIENFSVTTTYDDFLKQNGLRDHPSKHQKDSSEPFVLDQYNYRNAKFKNVRFYILRMLYDNIKDIGLKEFQYLKSHKYEVEEFIKNILRNNLICLTFSQEDHLFNDAHLLIEKASIKSE